MADHVIIQARDDIVTRLKAGVTTVANRVYLAHEVAIEEIDEASLPCLVVRVGPDADQRIAVGGGPTEPSNLEDMLVTYFVLCVVKQVGDAEKAAYGLRSELETTLLGTVAGLTLGGKLQMITRTGGAPTDDNLDQNCFGLAVEVVAQIQHLEHQPTSFSI